MSKSNGHATNGGHTTPVANLLPETIGGRDTQITQGEIESLDITDREREYIEQELERVLKKRGERGKSPMYTDADDWYREFRTICKNGRIREIPKQKACKIFINPELLYVKPKYEPEPEPEPESNHQTNHIPFDEGLPFDEDLPFGNDPIEEVKEQLSDEAILNSALERHNNSGIALFSPYITPDAYKVLRNIRMCLAYEVYIYLAGNVTTKTGKTHKRSRAELIEYFDICKRTWQRVEAVLRKNGLIEYDEDDSRRSHTQKVMFFLPHVADWKNNVQTPAEAHLKKTRRQN